MRQQPIRISIPHGWPNLPGQCPPYAPPSAETGRATKSPFPRPAPHLRHVSPPERRRYQDRLRDAGPLLGGIHPRYLRPCYHNSAEGSGEYDGERINRRNLKKKEWRESAKDSLHFALILMHKMSEMILYTLRFTSHFFLRRILFNSSCFVHEGTFFFDIILWKCNGLAFNNYSLILRNLKLGQMD